MIWKGAAAIAGLLAVSAVSAACAAPGSQSVPCAGAGKPVIVAAENFWGSIATQLAGERACVASVITNPDTDPHAYEASPLDARLVAGARYFIENGLGYDPWAPKLLRANPAGGRVVLDVGEMLGRSAGDNPHVWYSPDVVLQVADRITQDLVRLDASGRDYFEARNRDFRSGLDGFRATLQAIRAKYSGVPVGATESLFTYLADAAGLQLVTPPEFMQAISEGTDPTPADRATVQRQIDGRAIRVLVYNRQNSTKDVQTLVKAAKARGIPVVTITETLVPAGATFQAWQTSQLRELLSALGG